LRSWLYFLAFSIRQQARARVLVWTSLALLVISAFLVQVGTSAGRWSMRHERVTVNASDSSSFLPVRVSLGNLLTATEHVSRVPAPPGVSAGPIAFAGILHVAIVEAAALRVFVESVIVGLLTQLLLPLWTLTFAGESLGRFRDSKTLAWLLMRPIPRPALYLGGYLASLPWCLGLNLGGYAILCLLGGDPGLRALPLFWQPILLGTLAFAAFFQFLTVTFRRAGILSLLYVFFFEMIMGNMPGQQKRLCISYYIRSLIVDRMNDIGEPMKVVGTRPPMSTEAATLALIAIAVVLVGVGMWVFSRKEYLAGE
jgi:ABC-type transport system involved in multi-copper enzyme maturation permease subunit